MFGTTLIVFREVLEATILIGIISASTQNIPKSKKWITLGIVFGLILSGIVALLTEKIGSLADGTGQEVFNATILSITVLMLAGHNIWMSNHSSTINNAKALNNIKNGMIECYTLCLIVGFTIIREGSETVLFLYGIATTNNASTMLTGGLIGAILGILIGSTIFTGLIKIPMKSLFKITNILTLLLAASMASQTAHFLIQADLIPSLISPLWDTTNILPENNLLGILLHNIIGYNARPDGMQLIFYICTIITIIIGSNSNINKTTRKKI